MMTRIKIMSLALFSLLPTAAMVATETQPEVKKKIPPYLLKFHKELSRDEIVADTKNKKDKNLKGQPVDEKGCLLDKHKFAAYSLPIDEDYGELTFTELENHIVDMLNDSNEKRIEAEYYAKKKKHESLSREEQDKMNHEIDNTSMDAGDLFLYVVEKKNTDTLNEPKKCPYNLSIEEGDKVPAGSEIHILVNDIDIKNVEDGLKGLKKGWGTGTIVGVILGGAAVIGAAGGAIYYALQPKAPVKKEPKEEQNEEKLETAPKKTEVA